MGGDDLPHQSIPFVSSAVEKPDAQFWPLLDQARSERLLLAEGF
jgi:hypothetical protein